MVKPGITRETRKRFATLSSLILLLSVFSLAAGVPAAMANADDNGPGPYAAVDQFGHRYIFWQDSTTAIGEAFYNNIKWQSTQPIKNADVGSEPSIVVSPSQNTGGSNPNAYQFLFWIGDGSGHNLYMAYYGTGGWHGPYDLGMGDLGLSAGFAPAAVAYAGGTNSTSIMVAWIVDNYVHYAYSTNATDKSSWHGPITVSNLGPTNANEPSLTTVPEVNGQPPGETTVNIYYPDEGFQDLYNGIVVPGGTKASVANFHDGPLGSNTTSYSFYTDIGDVPDFPAFTFWQGTLGNLYGMEWDPAEQYNSGAEEYYAGQLGSTPSVAANSAGSDVWFYWICSNGTTLCQYYEDTATLTNLGYTVPPPS